MSALWTGISQSWTCHTEGSITTGVWVRAQGYVIKSDWIVWEFGKIVSGTDNINSGCLALMTIWVFIVVGSFQCWVLQCTVFGCLSVWVFMHLSVCGLLYTWAAVDCWLSESLIFYLIVWLFGCLAWWQGDLLIHCHGDRVTYWYITIVTGWLTGALPW